MKQFNGQIIHLQTKFHTNSTTHTVELYAMKCFRNGGIIIVKKLTSSSSSSSSSAAAAAAGVIVITHPTTTSVRVETVKEAGRLSCQM